MQLRNFLSHIRKARKTRSLNIALMVMCLACLGLMAEKAKAGLENDSSQTNDKALQEVRSKITEATDRAREYEQQANALGQEISELRQKLVTAAEKIQKTEGDIYETEQGLISLNQQESTLQESLKSRFGQMAKTLAAMQRLSQQPVELVAYRPDTAVNTLRTASLLRSLQPELKTRAEIIENDLENLQDVRLQITEERDELKTLLSALTSEQVEMNRLLSERHVRQQELRKATRDEREKLKQFAAQAQSLQELIARIEEEAREREKAAEEAAQRLAEKPKNNLPETDPAKATKSARLILDSLPNNINSFNQAKGTLPLPARGSIRRTFGSKTPEGQSSEGITIHTLPQATVISPHDGRIVFAGKFRSYGQLLIIAHGQEYHTLLAGMTRLDAEVGQWVLKGEPIGQMAPPSDTASTNGMVIGQNLYVELRRMGKPINPLPWIVARDRKVL